jgi:hypothetical protein
LIRDLEFPPLSKARKFSDAFKTNCKGFPCHPILSDDNVPKFQIEGLKLKISSFKINVDFGYLY